MSRSGWRGIKGIEQSLLDEAYAFEFYQAVRLLELRSRLANSNGDGPVPTEPVRFHASFDLSFPSSEIRDLRLPPGEDAIPEMTVSFFGVGGIDGPLPSSFTEEILERLSRQDTAVSGFLDIFHHRLLSLLYRIRKTHCAAMATDAPELTGTARYLFSLMGIGLESVSDQLSSPAALLRYAGVLAAQPRSATGLVTMLSDYFAVPMEIEQFVGAWCDLEPDQTTKIGATGQNNVLGRTAAVGTRAWIQDAGIHLRVGPLRREEFRRFLPGGRDHAALAELIRFYAGPDLHVTVLLLVRPEHVVPTQLGVSRVGWNAWLQTTAARSTDEQVHVRIAPRVRDEGPS